MSIKGWKRSKCRNPNKTERENLKKNNIEENRSAIILKEIIPARKVIRAKGQKEWRISRRDWWRRDAIVYTLYLSRGDLYLSWKWTMTQIAARFLLIAARLTAGRVGFLWIFAYKYLIRNPKQLLTNSGF